MSDKKPLPKLLASLVKKIAKSHKDEIIDPAENAVREWFSEISSDENPYSEDKKFNEKVVNLYPCSECHGTLEAIDGCFLCRSCGFARS